MRGRAWVGLGVAVAAGVAVGCVPKASGTGSTDPVKLAVPTSTVPTYTTPTFTMTTFTLPTYGPTSTAKRLPTIG